MGGIFCKPCQNRKMAALARIFQVVVQSPYLKYGEKYT